MENVLYTISIVGIALVWIAFIVDRDREDNNNRKNYRR